ncbi:MAG: hypothetical protein N3D16_07795, partial [Anaerolineales bacterium]|nr:hypothetical protein [Anaerolineales bacterium]
IPEYVSLTTSVTTDRPSEWRTPLGVFDFRHIQGDYFWGFRLLELDGKQKAFVATPEKALIDLIYLTPGGEKEEYLSELRLGNLSQLDLQSLELLIRKMGKPKLFRALEEIRKFVSVELEYESL